MKLALFGAMLVVAVAVLAACGGSGSDTSSSADTSSSTDGGGEAEGEGAASAIVAKAQKEVAAGEKISTTWPGPNEPVKPPAGSKSLGIIPCGPYGGCILSAKGAEQAAAALGWKSTLVTPVSGSPQEVNSIFLRLIDRGADAIIWVGFPRVILKQALAAAKEHEVPMFSIEAAEGSPEDVPLGDPKEPMEILGEQIAWWTIADSEGEAKVGILSDDEFDAGVAIDKGFEKVLSQCPDCEVAAKTDIQAAEEEKVAPGETITMLQRDPDIDYLFSPFESRVPFVVQGAREAQRTDAKVISTKAEDSDIESIASSTEPRLYASNNTSQYWTGWAAVDQLLRKWAGQPLVDHPFPIVLRTANNADAETYQPLSKTNAIDFPSEFKRLWGIE